MNKILVLNGSPRGKNSNTQKLVDIFTKGLSTNDNVSLKTIYLKEKNIKSCLGCFSCWKNTPGKCIIQDDVSSIIEEYISADLVIYATPIYHYGMTSILKSFIERTLPLNKPYIIKQNNKFIHPPRYNLSNKKHILISTCGFPQTHNFDILIQQFKKITGNTLSETICCVQGELLSVPELKNEISWYLDAIYTAGKEFIISNNFSDSTKNILQKPLIPTEKFIEMANLSWNVKGESVPSLDYSLGNTSDKSFIKPENNSKAYNFLKLMNLNFNKNNSDGINGIIEFEFTDLGENYYFTIKNQSCTLHSGRNNNFTTKIMTNLDTWIKISSGELDGTEALVNKLYRIKGDLNLLSEMGTLFSSENKKKNSYY